MCRACGGPTAETITTFDFMANREPFVYEVCEDCGTWQIKDIPGDIGKYYSSDYYSYSAVENVHTKAFFRNMAQVIIDSLKITEKDSVLDYGCGGIHLLKALHSEGLNILRGYDKFAPEVSWNEIKLQNTLPTDRKFSFIISKHCIEHEIKPEEQINNILSLLTKDGRANFVAPNPDSINARYWKGNWIGIDSPRHLNLLTMSAFETLVNKCGGEVISKSTLGDATNYLTSEMYSKGMNWKDRDKYLSDVSAERMSEVIGYSSVCQEMGQADMWSITIRRK
jgi:SAM-dependent methyltransferase